MLDELIVENFKAFGPRQRVPLAPITLIYGNNSAGKSSLIQALLALRQTAERRTGLLRDGVPRLAVRGELADLGSMDSLVHRHDRSLDVTLGWGAARGASGTDRPMFEEEARLSRDDSETFRFERAETLLTFSSEASRTPEAVLHLNDIPFTIDQRRPGEMTTPSERSRPSRQGTLMSGPEATAAMILAAMAASVDEKTQVILSGLNAPGLTDELRRLGAFASVELVDGPYMRLRNLSASGWIDTPTDMPTGAGVAVADRDLLAALMSAFSGTVDGWLKATSRQCQRAIDQVAYIGPLRKAPERIHLVSDAQLDGVGTKGEGLVATLAASPELLTDVNHWLTVLEIPYTLSVQTMSERQVSRAIGEVHCLVLRDQRGVEVALTDVGFGIGQVLPVIAEACVTRNGTLCVEQPELHLHPRLQARLGSMLAEMVRARPRAQFILETHSEHLLLRLQRLIRRGELAADKVCVLFVRGSADGSSRVERLRLEENGALRDPWPGGFFDERFDEIFDV